MAAFTTIAAVTASVGMPAAKGFLASDAAKDAAREAGRMRLKQQELEQESIARLEQNFYDAVRATTDVYDKALQMSNVQGSQILEAAQEGDQRGVAATAGKVKQVQDAGTQRIADKQAMQKLNIDMARAKAGEMDAARIAALQDDRAAAAGVRADAFDKQANVLEGQALGNFLDAGVGAINLAATAFGGGEGKAVNELAEKLGISKSEAQMQIENLPGYENFTRSDFAKIRRAGTLEGFGTEGYGTSELGDLLRDVKGAAQDLFQFKNPEAPTPPTDTSLPNINMFSNQKIPGLGNQSMQDIMLAMYPTMNLEQKVESGIASSDEFGDYFQQLFQIQNQY